MKIHSSIASDHRYPGTKGRPVTQRMKFFEGVQEDVLHEIIDFASRYSSQQNAVNHWRVKIVEAAKAVAVAFQDGFHQDNLNPSLRCRRFGGRFRWLAH